jgi:ketosteroid isomerase-like protein
MRHLVLLTALTLATACGDSTAPTAGPATLEETPAHRRPDLRRARESLIDAGNAVSAAIGTEGVAAGLGGALTSNTLLLSPRKPTIRGRDEAVAFLSGDPLAPTALSWEVIVADVSADASQGFTWAHGSFTLDLGAGPAPLPGFFLMYWRRTDGGRWKIEALVLNQGGPQPLPLPEGFGTPDSKHRRVFPHADVKQLRRKLLRVDAAFSQASVEHGTGPAFERYAAPNALAVDGTFLFGPEAIGQAFASGPNDVVSWVPRYADAAPSGDLGFTVGDAVFVLAEFGTFYTKYLTVWQRQKSGRWRFVADFGNSRPAPVP